MTEAPDNQEPNHLVIEQEKSSNIVRIKIDPEMLKQKNISHEKCRKCLKQSTDELLACRNCTSKECLDCVEKYNPDYDAERHNFNCSKCEIHGEYESVLIIGDLMKYQFQRMSPFLIQKDPKITKTVHLIKK